MTISFCSLKPGESAQLVEYRDVPHDYQQHLESMGLTVGTWFCVERIAPLGDPMQIRLRGFSLGLRKQEASGLRVIKR
ncbi:MAG: ferrous iron transport protein A [Pseudomonadales bacterium]|uniref:FeoA family protein n=1 Tax=unclassified Ketobacter TaxID=2639109 RepID=UPI000C4D44A7|nr:ferrous iron transport protein A [Pseudomonadales bacterium]MEC8809830.1 FeoA family protein [Pseudomonadota bacterium]RLT91073.1 MAG: ferrous iron transport protein A [Ketobacter sp. GenoA1]RLT98492.1 MAG: ferrous iron transport protein A [Ketobacter sp.]TNC86009.1 MAG: ferrous iron transport protein A [Alcanivorax sp.]HAG94853.1 ferrous iron transport protein A [Gammaproteobacteria bacterium]